MTPATVKTMVYGAAMRKRMLQLKARLVGSFGPKDAPHMAHDCASARVVAPSSMRAVAARLRRTFVMIGRDTPAGRGRARARTRNTSRWRTSPAPRDGRRGRRRARPRARETEHEVHADQPGEQHRLARDDDDHGEARVTDRRLRRRGSWRHDPSRHDEAPGVHGHEASLSSAITPSRTGR